MKMPKSIEVVRSSAKGLSSLSQVSAEAIVASLSKRYENVFLTVIDTVSDLDALIARAPGFVFIGMMYINDASHPTKRIWLSERLEQAGIPYTGSARPAHELGLHKDKAKQRVAVCGLSTARFQVIRSHFLQDQRWSDLQFPLFVKPLCGGGGHGVDEHSVVRTPEELRRKVASLHSELGVDVLVEEYLEGQEFSVAIIRDRASGGLTAMPLELVAPEDSNGNAMLSQRIKSLNQEQAVGVDDPVVHESITSLALGVFQALGARDYGRIDIRLDGKGIPHFLEANLIPSLISGYGSFPKAYKLNQGVEYDDMIHNIALLGLTRTTNTKDDMVRAEVLSLSA